MARRACRHPQPRTRLTEGFDVAANEGKPEACLTGWGSITRARVRRAGPHACRRPWALDRGSGCAIPK